MNDLKVENLKLKEVIFVVGTQIRYKHHSQLQDYELSIKNYKDFATELAKRGIPFTHGYCWTDTRSPEAEIHDMFEALFEGGTFKSVFKQSLGRVVNRHSLSMNIIFVQLSALFDMLIHRVNFMQKNKGTPTELTIPYTRNQKLMQSFCVLTSFIDSNMHNFDDIMGVHNFMAFFQKEDAFKRLIHLFLIHQTTYQKAHANFFVFVDSDTKMFKVDQDEKTHLFNSDF
jgi:hypothetical protein